MGFWEKFVGTAEPVETRDAPASRDVSWNFIAQGVPNDGLSFVSTTALESLSPIAGAVRLIAETLSSLPLVIYRKTENGREAVDPHPVAKIFAGWASEHFTGSELLECMTAGCLLSGAAYAEIVRNGAGQVAQLIPLPFGSVSPVQLPGGRIAFDITDVNGASTRRLLSSEVFALYDRRDGNPFVIRSRFHRAALTVNGALAAETFANAVFSNQASIAGILSHPNKLSKEAHERLRQGFERRFAGAGNAARTLVIEEGMSWQAIASRPDESQLLDSRRFGVEAVARLTGCPAPLLGDMSKSSYSNVQELGRQFLQFCLAGWLTKWEKRILFSLFSEAARSQFEASFDVDLLVRANWKERLEGYQLGRMAGVYSSNDLRRFEQLPTRSDAAGDAFLSPMNHMASGTTETQEPTL